MAVSRELPGVPAIPAGVNFSNAKDLPIASIPPSNTGRIDLPSLTFTTKSLTHLGEVVLGNTVIDTISLIPPETPEEILNAAIQRTREDTFKPDPEKRLIVATDAVADRIRSALPELPIVGSSRLKGIIKEDEVHNKYGVIFPLGETSSTFHALALVVDRLILTRNRGRVADHNHIHLGITDKIAPKPIKVAALLYEHKNALYIQKKQGSAKNQIGDSSGNIDNPLAQLLRTLALEASDNFLLKRELLDHIPLSTGSQELITLIAAAESARATGLPLGKVIDLMGSDLNPADLKGDKAEDYGKLIQIVNDELHSQGLRLMDLDLNPEYYRALNKRMAKHPRLGQILPSINTLIREGMIDMDRIYQIEKYLHSVQFRGVSQEVRDWLPSHFSRPDVKDTPAHLAHELDQTIQVHKSKPDSGSHLVETKNLEAVIQRGVRLREGDLGAEKDDPRVAMDKLFEELFLFNTKHKFLEQSRRIEAIGRRFLLGKTIISPAYREVDAWNNARSLGKLSPGRVIMASPDETTLRSAASNCIAINENDVLPFIDLKKLRDMGIIPQGIEVPFRGKGKTILMAWLWGMANGLIKPAEYVAHMDSDISNASDNGLAYIRDGVDLSERPPYWPLIYLGAAAALMPPSYRAVAIQPAKVGPPRKGEVKHPVFQQFAESEDPFTRMVGYGLGRVIWPSPGEAIVLSDLYTNLPWQVTTGLDLNRYMAAIVAELLQDGQFGNKDIRDIFAQVVIPPDKIEDVLESVPDKNDFREVNWATKVISQALDFWRELYYEELARKRLQPSLGDLSGEQKALIDPILLNGLSPAFPSMFSIDHIKRYNQKHAGIQGRVLASDYPESTRSVPVESVKLTVDGREVDPLTIDGKSVFEFDNSHHELFLDGGATILFPARNIYVAGGPNDVTYRYDPFYLPPVTWMIENGVIDLEGIRKNVHPVKRIRTRSRRFEE